MGEIIPLIAIIMPLAIPMVVIMVATQKSFNKKTREADIKRLIVQNNIDIERAKLLIEQTKPHDKTSDSLRNGAFFLGVGLGTLANHFLIHGDMIVMVLTIAGFIGLSLLAAFVVEYKMRQRDEARFNETE